MTAWAEAVALAAELDCEVTPNPVRPGQVEAFGPLPGVYVLSGSPEEIRAEVRVAALREWLPFLGSLGRRP